MTEKDIHYERHLGTSPESPRRAPYAALFRWTVKPFLQASDRLRRSINPLGPCSSPILGDQVAPKLGVRPLPTAQHGPVPLRFPGKVTWGAVARVESHSRRPIAYHLGPCPSPLLGDQVGPKLGVRPLPTTQHGPLPLRFPGKVTWGL